MDGPRGSNYTRCNRAGDFTSWAARGRASGWDLSNDRNSGFAESLMRILWNPPRTGFGDGFDLRSPSATF
jgi:hypothetical protein